VEDHLGDMDFKVAAPTRAHRVADDIKTRYYLRDRRRALASTKKAVSSFLANPPKLLSPATPVGVRSHRHHSHRSEDRGGHGKTNEIIREWKPSSSTIDGPKMA
jgi:hypothetical protein